MSQLEELDNILAQEFLKRDQTTKEVTPQDDEKLGYFTITCLILNRSIGSGIFVTPLQILLATNSVGISLILWSFGAFVAICGLTVWTEFGLTVPRRIVMNGEEKPVPRSGGEKNYLEYIMQKPKFLATSMFGIPFIILGNLAGNSIACASYILRAAGFDAPPRSWNIGVAMAILSASCMTHIFSRRGGIQLSNLFAIFKVLLLLAIIVIGFTVAGGARLGPGVSHLSNLSTATTFANPSNSVANYTYSFFYIQYTFSGWLQPFYVVSETKHPRKVIPRAAYTAMGLLGVLFVLVNIAYFVAIPMDRERLQSAPDMASLFLMTIFGRGVVTRAVSALIATSIFGNLLVMTFTAARVKQEIAKEGILFIPQKLSIAVSKAYATPDAWIRSKLKSRRNYSVGAYNNTPEVPHEQSPMAALLLHWFMSVLLVAATASLRAPTAYFALVFVYSYVIRGMVGFFVAAGLVYLYCAPSARWPGRYGGPGFRPWGGPAWAVVFAVVNLWLLVVVFVPPPDDSPFGYAHTGIRWYVLPAVGLSSLLWGVVWWCGLRLYGRLRGLDLKVARVPYLERIDHGEGRPGDSEWVQRSEIIVHEWMSREYIRGLDEEAAQEKDDGRRQSSGDSISV